MLIKKHTLAEDEAFVDIVDRSLIIVLSQCDKCKEIFARIKHPKTAKLDPSVDQHDHYLTTGHRRYTAIRIIIVYMCQGDKDIASKYEKEREQMFKQLRGKIREPYRIDL